MTDEQEKPWLEEVPAETGENGVFNKYRPQLLGAGAVVVVAFLGLIFYAYQSGRELNSRRGAGDPRARKRGQGKARGTGRHAGARSRQAGLQPGQRGQGRRF